MNQKPITHNAGFWKKIDPKKGVSINRGPPIVIIHFERWDFLLPSSDWGGTPMTCWKAPYQPMSNFSRTGFCWWYIYSYWDDKPFITSWRACSTVTSLMQPGVLFSRSQAVEPPFIGEPAAPGVNVNTWRRQENPWKFRKKTHAMHMFCWVPPKNGPKNFYLFLLERLDPCDNHPKIDHPQDMTMDGINHPSNAVV